MNLIGFISLAEKLKTQLRHSYTSNSSRQESVAEHTWMICLLAILIIPKLQKKLDLSKVLQLAVIHDLAEAITGDIPAFETSERKANKAEDEENAMQTLLHALQDKKSEINIQKLWEEYEQRQTEESRLVKALDKLEVLLQHNNADISTWHDGDFGLNPYDSGLLFQDDTFLTTLKQLVDTQTMEKIEASNMINRVKSDHLKRWEKEKNSSNK